MILSSEHGPVGGRVRREGGRICEQGRAKLQVRRVKQQLASHRQTVPAVISLAAQHQYSFSR